MSAANPRPEAESVVVPDALPWSAWLERLHTPAWRTPIYHEMVEWDLRRAGPDAVLLDVGCGHGFDGESSLQEALAQRSRRAIGIEPDAGVALPPCFHETHRSTLEGSALQENSVDVAYSIMVLEHVEHPHAFWTAIHRALRPGGVFWGFTINADHWFAPACRIASVLRVKSLYLTLLRGTRGAERVEDYPVYYRTNTRDDVRRLARGFSEVRVATCGESGATASYFPRSLRPFARGLDRGIERIARERINLVVRAVK